MRRRIVVNTAVRVLVFRRELHPLAQAKGVFLPTRGNEFSVWGIKFIQFPHKTPNILLSLVSFASEALADLSASVCLVIRQEIHLVARSAI